MCALYAPVPGTAMRDDGQVMTLCRNSKPWVMALPGVLTVGQLAALFGHQDAGIFVGLSEREAGLIKTWTIASLPFLTHGAPYT